MSGSWRVTYKYGSSPKHMLCLNPPKDFIYGGKKEFCIDLAGKKLYRCPTM